MKIKEVMSQTGLPERTIRYYEECGLIHPKTDYANGRIQHFYSEKDIIELQKIIILRRAQFSIEEVLKMQQSPQNIPGVLSNHHRRIVSAKTEYIVLATLERFADASSWFVLADKVQQFLVSNLQLLDTDIYWEADSEYQSVLSAYGEIANRNRERWNEKAAVYTEFNNSDRFLAPILADPTKAFHHTVFQQIQHYLPNLKGKKYVFQAAVTIMPFLLLRCLVLPSRL